MRATRLILRCSAVALAATMAACATAWFLQYDEVNILSDPPGARIEMNHEDVGRTPLTLRYRRGGARGQANQLVIRASAQRAESCSETRVIDSTQRTPRVVYFELGACARGAG